MFVIHLPEVVLTVSCTLFVIDSIVNDFLVCVSQSETDNYFHVNHTTVPNIPTGMTHCMY